MPVRADLYEIRDTTNIGVLALELDVQPPTREQELDAARFVASRARALGWTRADHETVLSALFQPVRGRTTEPDPIQEA